MSTGVRGIVVTELKRIRTPGGDVFHAMRATDPGYAGFGEAYLTTILPGSTKSWKRHLRMTLNLVVVAGHVRFGISDDRPDSPSRGKGQVVDLGPDVRYARLTIPPGLWVAFRCMGDAPGLILNVADRVHDDAEAERAADDAIPFDWSME